MTHSPQSADAQLASLLYVVGIAPLDNIGWIRVTGSDRLRWLNGMVTNSILQLAPGEGCYNFVLNAQGRILGDLNAFLPETTQSDFLLIETDRVQIDPLLAHLNHFIIMDDVELADITAQRSGLLLVGSQAASLLGRLDLATVSPPCLHLQSTVYRSAPLDILHTHSPLLPRIELWSDAATIRQLTSDLLAAGTAPVSAAVLEQLRILEGTPRYGTDIRNSEAAHDLPQETIPIGTPSRALHFAKGCYLGQEIVERIRSRGNVHRTFSGFALTGSLPAPGAVLEVEGKPVGEITSVTSIQLSATESTPESTSALITLSTPATGAPIQLALGYLRREALDRNQILTYPGGTATPAPLPFAIL
jgi:folate-binding protein YgfZ